MKSLSRREVAFLIFPALCLSAVGFYLRQRERILENQPSESQVTKIQWSVPLNQGVTGPVRIFDIQMTWKGLQPVWWGKPPVSPRIISMTSLSCDGKSAEQKLYFAGGGAGWFYEDQNVYKAENYFTTGKNGVWPSCVEAKFAFMNDVANPPFAVYEESIRFRFKSDGEVQILK